LGRTSYTIPNTITKIKEKTFLRSALTAIEIPSWVTEIGANAFANCFDLTTVTFAENSTLKKIDDWAFYYGGLTGIIIPDSVETIGTCAFASCYDLEYAVFSQNSKVTSIGKSAFESCTKLTVAVLPKSIKTMSSSSYGTGSGEIFYCGTQEQLDKVTITDYIGYWNKKNILFFGTDWEYGTNGMPTKITEL
jgi:hypothetical protein